MEHAHHYIEMINSFFQLDLSADVMLLTSSGEALDVQPSCMGIYRKEKGVQYNHRPVWKHETNKRYLCFAEDHWVVSKRVQGKIQKTFSSYFTGLF